MDGNEALDKAMKLLAAKLPTEALQAGLEEMDGADQEHLLNWLGK